MMIIAIIALPVAAYAGYKVMDRLDRFLDCVHIGNYRCDSSVILHLLYCSRKQEKQTDRPLEGRHSK